ncbi:peptidase M50 [Segniliparus rotundus DSM 44985]|uniref:Peptidase M50 n=1 Tax=Segniliparus rotundus (strain ATCC BAA-972 / CDC 1076 / CIP 108378 / DSM 44985 / JCM 13578) TaxID=640132 RepID=D6Z8F5_SEGRD|nr:site-2 protease family protein [Segniliparus rotundus]ADG98235.1 peptidase M50 [Segniliparus rotundus DSM 44985]
MSYASAFQGIRPSPVFLGVLAATALGGALAWFGDPGEPLSKLGAFVFVLAGWLVTLCLHEFGHAFAAWRFGDHDVAIKGYLDLDIRRYTDPLNSLVIPLVIILIGGIGLPGAAVYLDTQWMQKKKRTIVSLAGPGANLLAAVVLLGAGALGGGVPLFRQTLGGADGELVFGSGHLVFWGAVEFLGLLQVFALVINLLPIPGLDGYGAIEPWLSYETQRKLYPVRQWAFLVLFLVLLMPNPLGSLIRELVWSVFGLLGGNQLLAVLGQSFALPWQR